MKKGKVCGLAACFVLYSAAVAGIFYTIGIRSGDKDIETQTFYAEITDISGGHMVVSGLSVNDINFRGDFTLSADNAEITWRYEEISAEDLDVGDNISITFAGDVQERYPAGLTDVVKIELLN